MKTTIFSSLALIAFASTSCGSQAPGEGSSSSSKASALGACTGDWVAVDSPNVGGGDNVLASIAAASPSDVWAVGQYAPDANPNMTLSLALHFDGTAWSVVTTPNVGAHANALLAVTSQPGAAFAVGYDIGEDFLAHSLIEAYSGQKWTFAHHPQPFETENLYGA